MTIWKGKWISKSFPNCFMQGEIKFRMPDKLESLNNTLMKAKVKYTGVYKKGTDEIFKGRVTYKNGIVHADILEPHIANYTIELVETTNNNSEFLAVPKDGSKNILLFKCPKFIVMGKHEELFKLME